jgi:hypothetical protein
MTEHLSAGEWERWREDDREWKKEAMRHLIDHSERLTVIETNAGRAETAANSAESAKKWTVVGNVIGVMLNAILVGLGVRAGG